MAGWPGEAETGEGAGLYLDLEAINFEEESSHVVQEVSATISNKGKDILIVRLKCSDLSHFRISPATAHIQPDDSLDVLIERRPHTSLADQFVQVHFLKLTGPQHILETPNAIKGLFAKAGRSPYASLILRKPRKAAPTEGGWSLVSIPSVSLQESQTQVEEEDRRPPPLSLNVSPNPNLFFFPSDPSASTEAVVTLKNESERRVAVGMKGTRNLQSAVAVEPSDLFIAPGESEEVRLRRIGGLGPANSADSHHAVAFLALYAPTYSAHWNHLFEQKSLQEMATTLLPIHILRRPFVFAPLLQVPFFRPHSSQTIAHFDVRNISPFPASVVLRFSSPNAFLINPSKMELGPDETRMVAIMTRGKAIPRSILQIHYWAGKETAEPSSAVCGGGATQAEVAGAEKKRPWWEWRMELRRVDEFALSARLSQSQPQTLELRNFSQGTIAVEALPTEAVEEKGSHLLGPNSTKTLALIPPPANGASLLRISFAYALPKAAPESILLSAIQQINPASIAQIHLPLKFPV